MRRTIQISTSLLLSVLTLIFLDCSWSHENVPWFPQKIVIRFIGLTLSILSIG
jgi:hypothetical protein